MTNSEYAGVEGFVKVVFTTGSTTNRTAPSPTRKIRGHYYFGADGAEIWVHQDDQKARPDLYKLIEKPKPTTTRKRRKRKVEEA